MLKISENNGTEETGLVTPTPGDQKPVLSLSLDLIANVTGHWYPRCEKRNEIKEI